MAKVTGPLMSMDARGKFGNAMVFMGWKGIKTARMWIKPMNPQSTGQGNIRTILGATGRAVGKIIAGGKYATKLIGVSAVPDQQSKQSYLVQFIKDNYVPSTGATMKSNYATLITEFNAYGAKTSLGTKAALIGLSDFGMVYDDIATFPKGLGLYLIAKAAVALSFTGAPYTKTFASWTAADVTKLVNHMTT